MQDIGLGNQSIVGRKMLLRKKYHDNLVPKKEYEKVPKKFTQSELLFT